MQRKIITALAITALMAFVAFTTEMHAGSMCLGAAFGFAYGVIWYHEPK